MLNPWFISVLIIIITTFIVKRLQIFSSKHHKNLPPSPPTLPIIGNLHQLGFSPHRSLQRLSLRYGPLMLLKFGSRDVIIISSADTAREIMKTKDSVFSSRPKTNNGHKLLYQQRNISLAPYGEYWRQIRSLCVLHLLSAKRVLSFRPIREEETALLLNTIREHGCALKPVNLSDMFASLTNDLICRAAFGKKYRGDDKTYFRGLLTDLMRILGSFNAGDYIPSLRWINRIKGLDSEADRIAKAFDEFLDGIVDEHVRDCKDTAVNGSEEKKDLVDVLLQIQEDSKKSDFPLETDSIKAILLDMFVGGTDTTYTVLEWAMTELVRHPLVLKKLLAESIQTAIGRPFIPESDLDKMPYLKAVIKETLRLYPPAPLIVPHESSQDTQVNGFDIAAGTIVITNAWAIGRDPASWDRPEEFEPERFLNNSSNNFDFKMVGNEDFRMVPFGAGRRGCPGVLFSMVAIELVLANLVHSFNWELPSGVRREDLDMTECDGFIGHRKYSLLAVAIPRF